MNTAHSKYFVYLSFSDQLKMSIQTNFEHLMAYKEHFDTDNDLVTDVQSGIQFKMSQKNHSNKIVLSITVNTDGAKIYNSSSVDSIWPIQIQQNFCIPKCAIYHRMLLWLVFIGASPI